MGIESYKYLIGLSCYTLSLFFLLFVIILTSASKLRERLDYRLVLYASISVLMLSTSIIVPLDKYSNHSWLCQLQGLLNEFGALSCTAWLCVLPYNAYTGLKYEKNLSEYYYLILSYAIPALISLPQAITNSYTNSYIWCAIDSVDINKYTNVSEFIIPIILSILCNVYTFVQTIQYLNNFDRRSQPEEYRQKVKVFCSVARYCAWIYLCFIPIVIHRLYYFYYDSDNDVVDVMGIVGETIIGFGFSVCFVWNLPQWKSGAQINLLGPSSLVSVSSINQSWALTK
jgi:7 transmembrane receptor (Secretin family)